MNGSASVKKEPCVGCVYYEACGNSGRTVPCDGRMTRRERRKIYEQDKKDDPEVLHMREEAPRRG